MLIWHQERQLLWWAQAVPVLVQPLTRAWLVARVSLDHISPPVAVAVATIIKSPSMAVPAVAVAVMVLLAVQA